MFEYLGDEASHLRKALEEMSHKVYSWNGDIAIRVRTRMELMKCGNDLAAYPLPTRIIRGFRCYILVWEHYPFKCAHYQ